MVQGEIIMNIYFNIVTVFYISFFMILWFLSDIVDTFTKITQTQNILKIKEFNEYKFNKDAMINYPEFLYQTHPGWITKLLSCPICICFWSTLISVILTTSMPYTLFVFPVNYISSLLLYLLIKKLL